MFYSHFLFVRQGPLAKIWLASHILRQLKRSDIASLDITAGAQLLMGNAPSHSKEKVPVLALRLCGQLLYGLVKIYQKKVDMASEEALDVLRKLEAVARALPEEGAAANGKKGRRKEKISLQPEDLRAAHIKITLPEHALDSASDADYSNLGAGLLDDYNMGGPLGGVEGDDMEEKWGKPDVIIDFEKGSVASGMFPSTPIPINQLLEDEEGERPLDDDGIILDVTGNLNVNDVTGDRAQTPLPGANDNESILDGEMESKHGDGGGGVDFGDDIGLGGGAMDDAPDMPVRTDSQTEAELERLRDELARKKAESKRLALVASKKRRAAAFQPVVDESAELSGSTLKSWLADVADISYSRAQRNREAMASSRPRGTDLDRLTSSLVSHVRALDEAGVHPPDERSDRHLFDLPSTGLGRDAYASMQPTTQAALHRQDLGRWNPALMRMLASRLTLAPQMPGIVYDDVPDSVLAGGNESIAAAALPDDNDAGIGPDMDGDLNFGNGPDPFDQGVPEADQTQMPMNDVEEPAIRQSGEQDIGPDEFEQQGDDPKPIRPSRPVSPISIASEGNSAERLHRWWNEEEGFELVESVKNGQSVRTQIMLKKLVAAFAASRKNEAAFSALVDRQHGKAVAATSFYQLLVLKSSGIVIVTQAQDHGEIIISKGKEWKVKLSQLPSAPSSSGNQ